MKAKMELIGNQVKMTLTEEAYQRMKVDADKAGISVEELFQKILDEQVEAMFPGKFPPKA